MGWRNESFRGYADYMQTGEFESALNALGEAAAEEAIAICVCRGCAVALPSLADFGCSDRSRLSGRAHQKHD